MPLWYPGIDVPPAGLTIRLDRPWPDGKRHVTTSEGHGWLRLIVRRNRTPVLCFDVSSNTEALPERVADFSITFQLPLKNCDDDQLSKLDLLLSTPTEPSLQLHWWAKDVAMLESKCPPLERLRLRIVERDADGARIAVAAAAGTTTIGVDGWIRAVAPDSVVTRAARASQNKGWLALSNFNQRDINDDWDLVDGD